MGFNQGQMNPNVDYTFTPGGDSMGNDLNSAYNISNRLVSGSNPTLTLVRNVNYTFNVNASGHPFWINETPGTGTENSYDYWVTNNGEDNGQIIFLVSGVAGQLIDKNSLLAKRSFILSW